MRGNTDVNGAGKVCGTRNCTLGLITAQDCRMTRVIRELERNIRENTIVYNVENVCVSRESHLLLNLEKKYILSDIVLYRSNLLK